MFREARLCDGMHLRAVVKDLCRPFTTTRSRSRVMGHKVKTEFEKSHAG